MTKKCDYCKEHIDLNQGGYANVYNSAWNMTSYHIECYRKLVVKEVLK